MKRIEGVDALRGILACGVMIYHFLSWSHVFFYEEYSDIFELLAVSFVEMFFIISGFSLFYVYRGRLHSMNAVYTFFRRRFFRIAPLFYSLLALVIAIKLILSFLGEDVNRPLDLYLLFVNVTFLFGLVSPSDSLVVSGWSIGVEMAMYLFFPLLLFLSKEPYHVALVFFGALFASFYYSHLFLDMSLRLEEQWPLYVGFINHMVFFVAGFACFFIFNKYDNLLITKEKFFLGLMLLISMLILLINYFPNIEQILIGGGRILLLLICGLVVILFAIHGISNKLLSHLGELSYSIYLGHFFVYLVVERVFEANFLVIIFGMFGTYLFALFTYKYIEVPMILFGKRSAV